MTEEPGATIGNLPAALGLEVLSIVGKFAGGKPLTPEVIGKLDLPAGVTVEDAIECVRWAQAMREKQKTDVFHMKQNRGVLGQSVRPRLAVVSHADRSGSRDRRARMAKESRRRNRR